MPSPRPRGPAPLGEGDVARLRDGLAAGSEPRVQLLVDTAAAPAGTRGPVVALRDPAAEPEFVVLRVGGDEVPFSPGELTWPVRAPRGRSTAEAAGGDGGTPGASAAPRASPQPSAGPPASAQPSAGASPRAEPPAPVEPPASAGPSVSAGPPVSPAPPRVVAGSAESGDPSDGDRSAAPAGGPVDPAAGPAPVDPPGARPRPRRAAPRAGAEPFTVTLRFTGTEWTAETTRGGRRGKPRPVPVAALRAMAERLDDPELRRSVLTAVEACRDQARARAERLRAELEQVETVLAQLDDD